MLARLRKKSICITYIDQVLRLHIEQGYASYLDSYSTAEHKQRLSKKNQEKSFLSTFDVVSKEFKICPYILRGVSINMILCFPPKSMLETGNRKGTQIKLDFPKRPFLLGETEVTQELYESVLGENPSVFQSKNRQLNFKKLYPFSDRHPVEAVSWYDAVYFCNQLSALEGLSPFYVIAGDIFTEDIQQEIKYENVITSIEGLSMDFDSDGYRLPFPYEWEYAAKAGTQNLWAGTNDAGDLGDYAWYQSNSNGSTNPVATKLSNEWGFYDMSGNVSEWCNELDCSTEKARVRGGNCLMSEASARIDGTDALPKGKPALSVGFRLARSIRS